MDYVFHVNTIQENSIVFVEEALCRIGMQSNSPALLHRLREVMSSENKEVRFMEHADERNYLISDGMSFYEGLLFDVISTTKSLDPSCRIDITRVSSRVLPLKGLQEKSMVYPQNDSYVYRDYQEDAIQAMMKYGRGVIAYATGAGKSLIQYGSILNFWERVGEKKMVLLLVPNIQLVSQMYKDFLDYGCPPEDISMFSSANVRTKAFRGTPIIVTNRDWVLTKFKTMIGEKAKIPKPFDLGDVGMVIVDECHGLSDKMSSYSKFIRKIPTKVKFGFSGTVPSKERPDSFKAYGSVIGTLGPVLRTKKASALQDENVLASISIASVVLAHTRPQPQPPKMAFVWEVDKDGNKIFDSLGEPKGTVVELDKLQKAKLRYPMEWDYLERSPSSNGAIARFVTGLNGNTILLYDHNLHGDILEGMIKSLMAPEKKLFRIFGQVKLDDREDIRAAMEEGNNCILVANTKCFSTGINIRNIRNIVFGFTAGQAAAKIIQSIGRGLRRMETKTSMLLVDISHNYKYSSEHFQEREVLYAENYRIEPSKFIKKVIRIDDRNEEYEFSITSDNLPKPGANIQHEDR